MIPEVEAVRPRRRWGFDLFALLSCAAVILVAAFLVVRPDGRIAPRADPDRAFGSACNSVRWFGLRCPGCGLTRSFVMAARGDVAGSFRYHTLGPVLFLLLAAQVPYRIVRLARPGWGGVSSNAEQVAVGVLVVLGLLVWLVEGVPTGFRPV